MRFSFFPFEKKFGHDLPRPERVKLLKQFHYFNSLKNIPELLQISKTGRSPVPFNLLGLTFQDSQFQVFLKLGWADHIFREKESNEAHTVHFYRKKWHGHNFFIYCHFANGKLIMVQATYPGGSSRVIEKLTNTISNEYHCSIPPQEENYCIINPHHDRIVVKNEFYLNLFFISSRLLPIISPVTGKYQEAPLLKYQLAG